MNHSIHSNDKPSICFVSLDSFAALVDDSKYGRIGGAEIQQALIGRELAKRGYKVTFITLDHGQDDKMEIDGIRIIKAYNPRTGARILRFLHPRLTSLWLAMKRADADIYYQRTGDSITGIVAFFCRKYRRKFVFAVASEAGCVVSLPYYKPKHQRVLYRYGLRRANLVIAQTKTQQRLLIENFGIDSTVIPNCAPDNDHSMHGADSPAFNRRKRLLWIGGFNPIKRLELLLDIAEQHKDLHFDVIGDGNRQSEYVQSLRSRAESMPNVNLHGIVSHGHVQHFYQRATALICTSHTEGFPNVFLEAWSHGLPVVSTVDLDNVIANNGLGVVCKDIPDIVNGIRFLYKLPEQRQQMSLKCREFYLKNYTVNKVISKFEKVFIEIYR